MQQLSPVSVVLIALGLVVLINGLLLLSVARSNLKQQIRMLRRAATQAQDPWGAERRALEELDRRVTELHTEQDEKHE